ncbi:MAG: efflux transporter outer membrane subunit [Acidobacteria bacterium]|nr:efflux transporter outer membrane subunit [Acidobacteriota bacterium]
MRRPAIAALLFVSACTPSAPPATQPETGIDVPEHFGEESAMAPVAMTQTWWEDFQTEELSGAIEQALAFNADLVAAAARVDQAAAQARIAGADLKPQVSAGLAANRSKRNFVGFPIPGGEDEVLSTISNNFGVSVDLSWEIDLWGRLSAQSRQGLASFQATQADFQAVRLSIAGQTAKAWFAVAEAQLQLDLAERTVASLSRSADQVRDRFERGVRPPLDLRLALAQLYGAEAAVEARKRQLDFAGRQLEVLLGLYPGRDLEFPRELIATPAVVPAGLPAELVARRPDIVAAERRLTASQEQLNVARASLYPRLSLTASGGTSTAELTDLVKGDFSVWSLAGNLLAPIFSGGRLRAGVDLADAGVDADVAGYVGTALRAYSEVETTLAAETFLADRATNLEQATVQSQAAERLAMDRYRNGLENFITVLESQRRTFDAESAWIAGRRERLDNRVDLYLALGGGFDPTPIYDTQNTPAASDADADDAEITQ